MTNYSFWNSIDLSSLGTWQKEVLPVRHAWMKWYCLKKIAKMSKNIIQGKKCDSPSPAADIPD